MGKLYDRRDMAYELDQIDKAEQRAGQQLGPLQLAALDGRSKTLTNKDGKRETRYTGNIFEAERRRCRMKLLRTGSLVRDVEFAQKVAERCGICRKTKDGKSWAFCSQHKTFRWLFLRLQEAADENLALRLEQGRNPDGEQSEEHDGALNRWESWYARDQREGVWPGTRAWTGTQADLARMKDDYGSLDYLGWLNMLREEEEITEVEFAAEHNRLKEARRAQDSV